jgi:hypothetical protein
MMRLSPPHTEMQRPSLPNFCFELFQTRSNFLLLLFLTHHNNF